MATAVAPGPGPCARCARCTIRPGPRTAMSAIAGGRSRRSPARLDAFQWQTPVAALPSDKGGRDRILRLRGSHAGDPAPRRRARAAKGRDRTGRRARRSRRAGADRRAGQCATAGCRRRSGSAAEPARPEPAAAPAPAPPKPAESAPSQPAPLFRSRQDIPKAVPAPIPAVIPLIRAPDDPGVDDDGPTDEFAEQIGPPKAQAGGWRGFLSRWGGN